MLALREKAVNPNRSDSVQLPYISSLRIGVNTLHSMIDEELGDPLFHTHHEMRLAGIAEDIAMDEMDSASVVGEPIYIQEFPRQHCG